MQVLALGGKPGVILADCDEIVEMTVEDDWAEIVIASDGVWDVLRTEGIPQVRMLHTWYLLFILYLGSFIGRKDCCCIGRSRDVQQQ